MVSNAKINLPTSHPDVHKYLADEHLSTQIGNNNLFGCITMDQAMKKPLTKILRLLVALKDPVQKKLLCQGIILQPITEHLVLGNSDTW